MVFLARNFCSSQDRDFFMQVYQYKYRTKRNVQIPSAMYDAFYKDDQLLTLSYYLQIRALYKHPIIYNCTKAGLAKKLGISYNTLKFHLDKLEPKGIISFRDGHVHVLAKKGLHEIFTPIVRKTGKVIYKTVTIQVDKDIKKTKVSVRGILLFSKLRYQGESIEHTAEKQRLIKESDRRNLSGKETRRLKKLKKSTRKAAVHGHITISNKKIAETVGRTSPNTARRYKNILREMGLLDWRRMYRFISDEEVNLYFDVYNGAFNGARFYQGFLIRETSCQFRLSGEKFKNYTRGFKQSFPLWQINQAAEAGVKELLSQN